MEAHRHFLRGGSTTSQQRAPARRHRLARRRCLRKSTARPATQGKLAVSATTNVCVQSKRSSSRFASARDYARPSAAPTRRVAASREPFCRCRKRPSGNSSSDDNGSDKLLLRATMQQWRKRNWHSAYPSIPVLNFGGRRGTRPRQRQRRSFLRCGLAGGQLLRLLVFATLRLRLSKQEPQQENMEQRTACALKTGRSWAKQIAVKTRKLQLSLRVVSPRRSRS